MNTINKIGMGAVFFAVFLTLTVLGVSVNVDIETEPQSVNAAIIGTANLTGFTVWEQSAGPALVPAKAYTFAATAGTKSFNTGVEDYNVFISNSGGSPDASGNYITINCHMGGNKSGQDAGCNIDAVSLNFSDGTKKYATAVSSYGLGSGHYQGGMPTKALGAPDSSGLSGVTFLGSQAWEYTVLTLAFNMSGNSGGGTILCSNNTQCGTNGLVGSMTCNSSGNPAQNYRTWTCNSPGTTASTCTYNDVLTQQSTCTAGQTCGGAGVCSNTGTIACSTNSQCGTNGLTGSATCNGNSVYQNYRTYTCNNAGTTNSSCSFTDSNQFQNNCASNQTCSGAGVCTNNNTGTIACSNNSQCGSNGFIGSATCSGNSVYQNYRTYTCNNAGTTSSTCTHFDSNQLQTTCSANQICSGAGVCTNNNINTCIANSYQSCVNGNKYWFDSCGNQQSFIGSCGNTSTCTPNFTYRCDGNGVYWFDSCGNRQGLYQACTGNQTCVAGGNVCVNQIINNQGNLTVNVQVRNLSSGNLNWANNVSANPSDILQFQATIQANGNSFANNVTIRATLPSNLYYNNALMVDGVSNSGNIITGVNIGSLSYGQTRTVTYQVQVAPAQNFSFGTSTLYNTVNATSSDAYNNSGTGSAWVTVTRSGVLGATDVSTGLTNNFWVDSFFLPLMLALAALWAWKSGALSNLLGTSQSKLENRIAQIKEKESL